MPGSHAVVELFASKVGCDDVKVFCGPYQVAAHAAVGPAIACESEPFRVDLLEFAKHARGSIGKSLKGAGEILV